MQILEGVHISKRMAQPWARQFIEAVVRAMKNDPLPYQIMKGNAPFTLARGKAIRWTQESNLAIKQHNVLESKAQMERSAYQKEMARGNASSSIPNYEPQFIIWRIKAIQVEGTDEWALWATVPQPTRQRGQSALSILSDEFCKEVMTSADGSNPLAIGNTLGTFPTKSYDDMFEEMLLPSQRKKDET